MLPANWFDEEAIDVPIVCALVSETFDIGELKLFPQGFVQIRQLVFVLTVQISDVEIVEVLKVVNQISDGVTRPVEIDTAHCTQAEANLGYGFRRNINAKEMIFSFDASFEID